MNILTKVVISLCLLLGGFITGLLFGKSQCASVTVQKVEYLPSDTVFVQVDKPVPYRVEVPKYDTITLEKYVILYKDTILTIDTFKVVQEFFKKKYYDQELINDSTGYIRLEQVVAMNEITSQKLTYVPVTKVVTNTIESKKKFQFGVGAEYITTTNELLLKGSVIYKQHYQFEAGIGNQKSIGFKYLF